MRGYVRLFFLLFFFSFISIAQCNAESSPEEQTADKIILLLEQSLKNRELSNISRLNHVSSSFLGKPYFWGPLGEGIDGQYDQYPLYRIDQFDCLTYVETVLAIALTDSLDSFRQRMGMIRYREGKISFIARNHFTDLDWNKNNQENGILKDITGLIHDENNHSVAEVARANIDKPSWYEHVAERRIRLLSSSQLQKSKQSSALKQQGKQLRAEISTIPYIPLSVLFDAKGKPNKALFQQIPDGAIVEIVRPNWDLTSAIGTHLNVSHLGFVFWGEGVLMFRNASTIHGKVVEEPLIDYLNAARQSPTIKGINVQTVNLGHTS